MTPAAPHERRPLGVNGNWSYWLLLAASIAMYLDPVIPLTSRNFLLSDILILLSLAALVVDHRGRDAFVREALRSSATIPIGLFLLCAVIGFSVHAALAGASPSATILAVLQLGFAFFIMGPVIFVHLRSPARLRALWTVQIVMIAFAGLVSLSDFVGITSFGQPEYWREVNPLLGVNGFWLFGMISPVLLMRIVPDTGRHRVGFAVLWAAGFTGVVLGGVRVGLVLTVGSLFWVGRRYLGAVVRPRFSTGAVKRLVFATALLGVITVAALGIVTRLPVFQTRFTVEAVDELNTIAKRLDAITIAFAELPRYLGIGAGLHQFLSLHPEAGDLIHNQPLQAAYETGILGAAAWLLLFWTAYRNANRWRRDAIRRHDTEMEDHWDASKFAVLGALLAGMVYPIGLGRFDWFLFLLATGPGVRRLRLPQHEVATVESATTAASAE